MYDHWPGTSGKLGYLFIVLFEVLVLIFSRVSFGYLFGHDLWVVTGKMRI